MFENMLYKIILKQIWLLKNKKAQSIMNALSFFDVVSFFGYFTSMLLSFERLSSPR